MPRKTSKVSSQVADIRQRLGLTQQQFATSLGLSTVSVSRWEHDHTTPTDNNKMLFDLLERALKKHKPAVIVQVLADYQTASEVDRVSALVGLSGYKPKKRSAA